MKPDVDSVVVCQRGPVPETSPTVSQLIPAIICKCVEARESSSDSIEVWGTGSPTREFLYVDDAARAIVIAAERYNKADPVNLGSSEEISIKDLIELIAELTEFKGRIKWDKSKPDGQPRRKLNVERAWREFGFRSSTNLRGGLQQTIRWYQQTFAGTAGR